jgi:hypothetical protein
MKKYLFYFAAICWILGLIVHIQSLIGINVTEQFPYIWLLHVGIFVVWIPVVLDLNKNDEYREAQRNRANPLKSISIIFKDVPQWLKILALVGFVYAIINFLLFMATQSGTPDFREGQYILHNRGEVIKILTEQEYHHYKANEVRGFSGHWLAFYGMAMALLYKYRNK